MNQIEIEQLSTEQAKWYTGEERDDVIKVFVINGHFPTELFCGTIKGWYDIKGQGYKNFGMLKGFCGSGGQLFERKFLNKVKDVLLKHGYIIKKEI